MQKKTCTNCGQNFQTPGTRNLCNPCMLNRFYTNQRQQSRNTIYCKSCGNPVSQLKATLHKGFCNICFIREQKMASQTSIVWDETQNVYVLKFAYPPRHMNMNMKQITEAFKQIVPSACRECEGPPDWNWHFTEEYYEKVQKLLSAIYSSNIFTFPKPTEQPNSGSNFTDVSTTLVTTEVIASFAGFINRPVTDLETLTLDAAQKEYRKAAIRLHPDRNGGDGSKMSELNQAWTFLKEIAYFKQPVGV